uniref:Uncharacterized protein n=1 Tax=viral metagenome TaxID=1070528 RepID=A0A6M3KZQ2_9ZZZZ
MSIEDLKVFVKLGTQLDGCEQDVVVLESTIDQLTTEAERLGSVAESAQRALKFAIGSGLTLSIITFLIGWLVF